MRQLGRSKGLVGGRSSDTPLVHVDHESCFVLMGHGLYVLWVLGLGPGSWVLGLGSWVLGLGSWVMGLAPSAHCPGPAGAFGALPRPGGRLRRTAPAQQAPSAQ